MPPAWTPIWPTRVARPVAGDPGALAPDRRFRRFRHACAAPRAGRAIDREVLAAWLGDDTESIEALLVSFATAPRRPSASSMRPTARAVSPSLRRGAPAEGRRASSRAHGSVASRRARAGRQGRRQTRLPQQSRAADRGTSPGAKRDAGVGRSGPAAACAVCAGANSERPGQSAALLPAVLGVAYRSTTSSD